MFYIDLPRFSVSAQAILNLSSRPKKTGVRIKVRNPSKMRKEGLARRAEEAIINNSNWNDNNLYDIDDY